MESSKTARFFLRLNAGFSLLIGANFLIAAGRAASLLFVEPAAWQTLALRVLGGGLVLFGLGLLMLTRNKFLTRAQVILISAMDIGWIVGSTGLIVIGGHLFSGFGQVAIIVVAGFVGVFALGQYIGARKMRPLLSQASVTTSDGKILARVTRMVEAPEDVVWRIMNDHTGYADVADNISKVEVVSGKGMGMQRRCYGPKGENWLETCDYYQDGHAYGFRIHTEAEDYPYPISDLHGEWSVERTSHGSRFAINIEAVPKGSFMIKTLFKMAAKHQFKAVLADLADAWAARMEQEARA